MNTVQHVNLCSRRGCPDGITQDGNGGAGLRHPDGRLPAICVTNSQLNVNTAEPDALRQSCAAQASSKRSSDNLPCGADTRSSPVNVGDGPTPKDSLQPEMENMTCSQAEKSTEEEIMEKKSYGIRIGSMNVRGKGVSLTKWATIQFFMKVNRIAIVALQETKLTLEDVETIEQRQRHLKIVFSSNGSNKEGVAFVIMKDLVTIENEIKVIEMIPGRLLGMQIKLKRHGTLNLINAYVPNEKDRQLIFLDNMHDQIMKHRSILPNAMVLGDWNCVTRECDRLPPRRDDETVTDMLELILANLGVEDGWAKANPESIDFTFTQERTTGRDYDSSQSRIDRIYTPKKMWNRTTEWNIIRLPTAVSDHDMATVLVSPENLPVLGKGAWRINSDIIDNPKFQKESEKILIKWTKKLERYKQQVKGMTKKEKLELRKSENPQIFGNEAKQKIKEAAINILKEERKVKNKKTTVLNKEINNLLKELKEGDREKQEEKELRSRLTQKHNELRAEKKRCYEKARIKGKRKFHKEEDPRNKPRKKRSNKANEVNYKDDTIIERQT
ncbi:Endonuclease/exonuclease/phosphatase [Armillaria mellea]|nr:Endonuclease/exonuclease/phosphatase [Armillaria mellea]